MGGGGGGGRGRRRDGWWLPPFSAVSQGGLYVVEHCEVWRYDLCVCVCHGGRIGLWDPILAKMTERPDVALTGQRRESEREREALVGKC